MSIASGLRGTTAHLGMTWLSTVIELEPVPESPRTPRQSSSIVHCSRGSTAVPITGGSPGPESDGIVTFGRKCVDNGAPEQ